MDSLVIPSVIYSPRSLFKPDRAARLGRCLVIAGDSVVAHLGGGRHERRDGLEIISRGDGGVYTGRRIRIGVRVLLEKVIKAGDVADEAILGRLPAARESE